MQFIEFQNKLSAYQIFSLNDINKIISDFNRIQLDRWEKKNYVKKLKRGFYCFSGQPLDEQFLFYTANKIYTPSYVSLEMALKYYGLIPEEIFQVTSVSTKKTASFKTPIGNFSYKHIKPSLYWGYRLVEFGQHKLLLAELEKAILDYLYIHPKLKSVDDFLGMRINGDELRSQISLEKFQRYVENFKSRALTQRAHVFLTSLHNDIA